ncbi:MAG: 5-(carboxyamino)imidazole ribonucleotide synthase [Alphaproteobacteria bacterium]|nr:5-(carboxyamino)imidazole ribonucleotide synthase [Alphaproteobacteria bacterium]
MSGSDTPAALPPGAMIGILGGGQLGRMTVIAAARLGYRCHVFCQSPDEPAAQIATRSTVAPFTDTNALDRFAADVDVVTLEFENIPLASLEHLAPQIAVRPNAAALAVAQDRIKEKDFITAAGIATAPYRAINGPAELRAALAELGTPAILKTARLGYDGKGQVRLDADTDPDTAWGQSGAGDATGGAVLEGFVDFEREISVIAARGADGAATSYVPVENRHANHILDQTIVPAPISNALAATATDIAHRLIADLQMVGVLAVEMFVSTDGNILVNEIAPRPHNSGHWTIDACAVSQFELLVRAVCGLPLGSTERDADAIMKNLIGDAADDWQTYLGDPAARLHLYGKAETRPGRKMGHVTWLAPRKQS